MRRTAFDMFGRIIREDATQQSLRMEVVDESGRTIRKLVFSAADESYSSSSGSSVRCCCCCCCCCIGTWYWGG